MTSCVSIPRQAPELSIELGNRLNELERSHVALLNAYFKNKRKQVDEFVESTWLPEFSQNFFNKKEIQDAWDKIVASDSKHDRLEFLLAVAPELQLVINRKREELQQPLNAVEQELESAIREQFNVARSMNNSLTSFLTSAAKVKENQQRYLDMIKVTDSKVATVIDQTDRILETLTLHSGKISASTENIKELNFQADEYRAKLGQMLEHLKK